MKSCFEGKVEEHCTKNGFGFKQRLLSRNFEEQQVCAYEFTPKEESKGLIVYLHGIGNDALFPQLQLFLSHLSQGYTIISFDLDGHGIHSKTKLHPHYVLSCLEEALDQVSKEHENIYLLGYSFGGALILSYLANAMRAQIKKAAVVATPSAFFWPKLKHLVKELRSFLSPNLYAQYPLYGPLEFYPAVGSFGRKKYPIRLHPEYDANHSFNYLSVLEVFFKDLDLDHIIKEVDTPVLFCYADQDIFAPPERGQKLSESCKGSKYLALEDETHFTSIFSPVLYQNLNSWFQNTES